MRQPGNLIVPLPPREHLAGRYPDVLPDVDDATLAVAPIERAETIPSSWYTHPAFHRFDQEAIFARTWQYAGHVSQLDRPGRYLRAEVAGNPVVVVRDMDGRLRAFYNVCRHRGGPLVTDDDGCVSVLKCRYHGWTYRLDGSLRGVPQFDRTELFDTKDYGLVPLRIDTWQGLVFVHPAEDPASLHSAVAGIAERIAPLRLDALAFYRRVTYDVACNWKVYADNYLEGYHVPLVHPELMRMLDYRSYATEATGLQILQHSTFHDDTDRYGTTGRAFYYLIFPNLTLNVLPGRLQTNLILPVGPDRTRVIFEYFYDDTTSPAARRRIEEDIAFADRVQQEDVDICEHVQRGLASRAYDRGRFSADAEQGVYHFQRLLKEAYRAALESPDAPAIPRSDTG